MLRASGLMESQSCCNACMDMRADTCTHGTQSTSVCSLSLSSLHSLTLNSSPSRTRTQSGTHTRRIKTTGHTPDTSHTIATVSSTNTPNPIESPQLYFAVSNTKQLATVQTIQPARSGKRSLRQGRKGSRRQGYSHLPKAKLCCSAKSTTASS